MTGISCLHCTAETTNGLALCETCRAGASVYLEFFPVYFRNLARWRPGRSGTRSVPSSREPQGPSPAATDRVSIALDEAANALVTWARMLADDRGITPPTADTEVEQVALLCRWLNEHLTSIATLEWAGQFMQADHREDQPCDGIGYHQAKLGRLTQQVIPGWYAGACQRDDCETSTYVVPGLTWVTCGGCGATTYARDHLETILKEARDWVARPMRLAETLVALVDTEQSVDRLHKRISKWGERGEENGGITPIRRLDSDGDETGPKMFRLGDVLNRVLTDGATRTDSQIAARAS